MLYTFFLSELDILNILHKNNLAYLWGNILL